MAPIRLALALLLLPALLHAQGPPPVHVLATGGTISNLGADRLSGDALVRSLPGVEKVADVSVEQFLNTFSGAITLEQWLQMADRINELFRTRPDLRGVIVTHGTDTMEETAFFLDLTVADCRPVILTGAMRHANWIGADGPANLYNSFRYAVDPRAPGHGTVVLMDDEVFPARAVTKTNTIRVETFEAPGAGRLAITDPDSIVFEEPSTPRACGAPAFDVSGLKALPRVDVVYSYQGADGSLIRAAVAAGARGIVVAGVGRGGATPPQSEAIREAVRRGVVVVMSSRTGSGRVPVGADDLADWKPGQGVTFGAGALNPQKARILLMLGLTRSQDPRELAKLF